MLESLLIEEQEQIDIIVSLCEYVIVNRTVSIGEYFTSAKEKVAIKRDGAIIQLNAKSNNLAKKTSSNADNKAEASQNKFSFFEV